MAENDVERRKSKRTQLDSTLVIKRLDGGDSEEVNIEISDVSKSGVGFICKTPLLIGTVYESYLTIWTKEVLHAFLQIVRIELKEDTYYYGASFVGMPEMDAARIATYQTLNENGI
ncbi:MAG: PilZ domain-containing protein [Lachnospiraceae bacterium]|nr:PilZ domain-containing protein [Lachnospiraceae bacterium]